MLDKIFHSENYLGSSKSNYFEGWYFRHGGARPFSFIAGISKNADDAHSFIQYIDGENSFYFDYPLDAFAFEPERMTVRVGGNSFSYDGIDAEIERGGRRVSAHVKYDAMRLFKKTAFAPSVMGPFSYFPMFCSHAVISLDHGFSGELAVDGNLSAVNGRGYIEKDYGSKFPENYFWMHASGVDTSIMCAVAWPLVFDMRGFLCVVLHGDKQYNLSLYTGAKLKEFEADGEKVALTLVKGKNKLKLLAKSNSAAQTLIAPQSGGKMNLEIKENLNAELDAFLTLDGQNIQTDDLTKCAFECVLPDKSE